MSTIADAAWQELVTRAIVRDPRTAGSLPPAWRQPVEGVKAPREGTGVEIGPTLVVGLIRTGGIAPNLFESQWVREFLDVWIRALKWPDAEALWMQIRDALTDRMAWTMGGMRVIQSRESNVFQLVDSTLAEGFTGRATILFETYRDDHH